MKPILYFLLFCVCTIISSSFIFAQEDSIGNCSCEVSLHELRTRCFACDTTLATDGRCTIEEFEELGSFGGKSYYSVIYHSFFQYDSSNTPDTSEFSYSRSVQIFESLKDTSKIRCIWESPLYNAGTFYLDPEFAVNKYGGFLHIFVTDGNGGYDDASFYYYKKKSHTWVHLDVPDFNYIAEQHMPKGFRTHYRGGGIDLKTLIFSISITDKVDPISVDHSGYLNAKLRLVNNTLEVVRWYYTPN